MQCPVIRSQRLSRTLIPIVIGMSFLLTSLNVCQSSLAAPAPETGTAVPDLSPIATNSETSMIWVGAEALPQPLVTGVIRDLAERLNMPMDGLRVAQASQETWTDSCLDVATADEVCTPASIDGWQLEVLGDRQSWFYHTNQVGDQIRLFARTTNLPPSVGDRLRLVASQELQIPITQLSVLEAEPWIWKDCLRQNVADNDACLDAGISGWRAILTSGQQQWIYHANQDGSEVWLNAVASQTNDAVEPTFISAQASIDEGESVLFREIGSSGVAGQAYQTILLTDGRLMQLLLKPDGTSAPISIERVSPRKLEKFVTVLQHQEFSDFNGLDYRPTQAATDEIIVMLIAPDGMTQYADSVQTELPIQLRRVIRAWKRLSSG